MNPDESKEQLHVGDILAELQKIADILKREAELKETPRGLLAMKVACKAYLGAVNGILPFYYRSNLVRECSQYVASAFDVARSFREVADKRALKRIQMHLNLIGIAGFGVSSTVVNQQDVPSRIEAILNQQGVPDYPVEDKKDAARKSLELMLGLAALGRFGDVRMEDPECSSKSKPNPDIIVPYKGENYGIACKSITTRNSEGIRDNIRKAVSQIDRAVKAKVVTAGRGLVFLDISSLIDHEKSYLPDESDMIWTREGAVAHMQYSTDSAFNEAAGVTKEQPASKLFADLFKGSSAAPILLVYAHTLMIADHGNGAAPSYMKCLMTSPIGDASRANAFVDELLLAIHAQPGPGK